MLVFLLSAFSMVSAGKDIPVAGFVKDNVLLPCDCSGRNLKEDFKWQVEGDEKKGIQSKLIFKYNATSNVSNNQFETFLDKDSSNCSILLKNITPDAQGKYACRFHSGKTYSRVFVILKVCGRNISQYSLNTPSGGMVYHCDVKLDCYRETDIRWTLNGQCLTNSSTNISITDSAGPHHFHSTLKTNSTFGSEPKCEVSPTCPPVHLTELRDTDPNPYLRTLCKVVPVVLVLGFLLIWCRRRGTSYRLPSEQDVETVTSLR